MNHQLKLPNLKQFYSLEKLNKETVESFRLAIKNVRKFHEKQYPSDYEILNMDAKLRSVWKPMDSVGLYVPGGNAVYPSSLIMSVSALYLFITPYFLYFYDFTIDVCSVRCGCVQYVVVLFLIIIF